MRVSISFRQPQATDSCRFTPSIPTPSIGPADELPASATQLAVPAYCILFTSRLHRQQVLESVDDLAERVRMIGQDPPVHLIELADLAAVATAAPHSTMRDMVEEAGRNALVVIKELR